MTKRILCFAILALVAIPLFQIQAVNVQASEASDYILNLYNQIKDPQQRLYLRTLIARPDGKSMVYYWKGKVYADIPGDIYAPLGYPHGGGFGGTAMLGFEGYNVRRLIPVPKDDPGYGTDFIQAHREIVFYTDPAATIGFPNSQPNPNYEKILYEFTVPLTKQKVPIVPVLNEYLFLRYRIEDGVLKSVIAPSLAFPVSAPEEWADQYTWNADVFPNYTLEERYGITDHMGLKTSAQFANGKYSTEELFNFLVPKWDLYPIKWEMKMQQRRPGHFLKKWLPTSKGTWVRQAPWFPFMCMSENEWQGRLVTHARYELLRSYKNLPQSFKEKMQEYFIDNNGQNLETIGLAGWMEAPTLEEYKWWLTRDFGPGQIDISYSVFYDKVLSVLEQNWDEWCEAPVLPEKPE